MATTYYVDFTTGDDGDTGLSEALAWKTLTNVNATSFAVGDTIRFKKGETWAGKITVPTSGSAGNVITFNSYGIGADPIIDGTGQNRCIDAWYIDYVKITGFECKNATSSGILARGSYQEICYNTFHHNGLDGISTNNMANSSVHHNVCHTNDVNGIGAFETTTTNFYSNTCYGNSIKTGEPWYAGIAMEERTTTCNVYYNICYDNVNANFLANGYVNNVYNNVFYGGAGTATCQIFLVVYDLSVPEDNVFKNNILYITRAGDTGIYMQGVALADNTFDYNCYYYTAGPDKSNMAYTDQGPVSYTFAQIQSAGQEAHGMCIDPLFIDPANANFHLQSGSPCRDRGIDVGLTIDMDGTTLRRG